MKIGIMGGTFDPVHYGHLNAAKEVRNALSLDSVLFIPTGNPAHKKNKKVTDATIRYALLEEAIAGEEDFVLSDLELRRDGAGIARHLSGRHGVLLYYWRRCGGGIGYLERLSRGFYFMRICRCLPSGIF